MKKDIIDWLFKGDPPVTPPPVTPPPDPEPEPGGPE